MQNQSMELPLNNNFIYNKFNIHRLGKIIRTSLHLNFKCTQITQYNYYTYNGGIYAYIKYSDVNRIK